MVKVSIIVPVYKVENYLRRCMDSLCNQTLREIEIIAINDCSPDNSLEILREYEKKDHRVSVINLEQNSGVAVARNVGIDVATGEFIGFVDSDDELDLNFYEVLYDKCISTSADIAKGARKTIDLEQNEECIVEMNENIRLSKAYFSASFWCAIYRSSMIRENNIRFPVEIFIGEDLVFQERCIIHSKKFVTSDFVFYRYYLREDSAVAAFNLGGFFEERKLNSLSVAFNQLFEYANLAFDEGKVDLDVYDLLYYNNLCFAVTFIFTTDDTMTKYKYAKSLIKYYQDCRRKEVLEEKLEDEQSSFYNYLLLGDEKGLTKFFVENYTLEDLFKANEVRSSGYFRR